VLRDMAVASSREWLLTDGLGGYASSTPIGLNTRRYHGLLVVATRPPLGRVVLLAKVDETLVLDGSRHELATNAYAGAVRPRGFESAVRFSLDPLPTLTWRVGGGTLSRTTARVHGEPATALVYSYDGPGAACLELRPLVAVRDHHALHHRNATLDPRVVHAGGDVVLRPYTDRPELRLRVPEGAFEAEPLWHRGVVYERERERGFDCEEDLFSHGVFRVALYPGEVATLLAWAGHIPAGAEAVELCAAERRRLPPQDAPQGGLLRAADAFVVRRGRTGTSVMAGYPWSCDGGRDAMIALPGLCLATGRHAEAREILLLHARQLDAGLIPSRFPEDGGPPAYDAADAPLWMVIAVQRYLDAGGDRAFVRSELQPAVFEILSSFRHGSRHGVRMTPEGLLGQRRAGVPLSWMDARSDGAPVTPREGETVELQALWYNALLVGAGLARRSGADARAREWTSLARLAQASFVRSFWLEQAGYLADVVDAGERDASLRPNQLYAIGLPHALLPPDKAARVLAAVKRELLTPAGLRSLAPSDPAYRGTAGDDQRSCDLARHQGSVWPHLMGVYFDALIRVHCEDGEREAREWLRGFAGRLDEGCLGFVAELFDGDPPHRGRGAVAQAWGVAELLRIALRSATAS
jgi:predicted glycogen debranching enzyme